MLSKDVTIISNINNFHDAERYYEVVLLRLSECRDKKGNAFVSIGTGSKIGTYPHFMISYQSDNGEMHCYEKYVDHTGNPFSKQSTNITAWSESYTNIDEVKAVLQFMKKGT